MTADDYIDNERHRKPARKVQGDPRPTVRRRKHPPRLRLRKANYPSQTFRQKYNELAARYEGLAKQAEGATTDDRMMGSDRTESVPSQTFYEVMFSAMRMANSDCKERDGELVRLIRKALGTPTATILLQLMEQV